MKRTELANLLTYLCLFFLPWQTVWIYDSVGDGEYLKLTHYAVQFFIVIAALIRWEIKGGEVTKKILYRGWWFLAAIFLSCFLSTNWYLSIGFFFHLFSAGLLFWLLLDERIETRKIIWSFSLGLIVPCLLGWWQVLAGSSPASTLFGLAEHLAITPGTSVVEVAGERLMRAYGTFAHPNIFGGYLTIVLLIMLARFQLGNNQRLNALTPKKIIPLAIIFLFSSTLIVTFSRSAWLALAVGITSFFIVSAIFRKKIPRKFLSGLAVVIVAAAATAALFSSAVFTRVEATDRLEEKSLVERQSEYQTIGEVIKNNPFVGVGPGAYTLALEKLNPGQSIWSYQPMHNSFLLFFAETGLLGLVFLIYFLNALAPWGLLDLMPFSALTPPKSSALMPISQATPLIAALTTLALLDHYLWSQWAGLALIVVIFAIFTRSFEQDC